MARRKPNTISSKSSSLPLSWWPGVQLKTFRRSYYSLFSFKGPLKPASFMAGFSDFNVLTGSYCTTQVIVKVILSGDLNSKQFSHRSLRNQLDKLLNAVSWALSTGSGYKVNGAFHNAIESSLKYCLQLFGRAFQSALPKHGEWRSFAKSVEIKM